MAIVIMMPWVLARQHVIRMDGIFFQRSVPGITGLALYLTGNYVGAAKAYREHFRGWVQSGRSTGDLSLDALLSGNLDLAEQMARKTVDSIPDGVASLLTLGEVDLERGRIEGALKFFREALDRVPNHWDALLLSSVAYAKAGSYPEAIDTLNRALRQNVLGSRLTVFLRILHAAGEFAERPAKERPLSVIAHYYRYLRIFDPSNARRGISYAEQAIAAGDRPADGYFALGVVYVMQGKHDTALTVLMKAVEMDQKYSEAFRLAAFIYSERGDLANEYRMIKSAFEAAPTDSFYLKHLDHVLMERLGDPHQVITVMQKALEFDPNNTRAHDRLGYAYGFIGDQARSVSHYKKAIELEPRNPVLYEGLGWALNRLKRPEEAIAAYQQAATISPLRYEPHSALGSMYHRNHKYREAITEYETALRLGDPNIGNQASLCAVYHFISEFQRAVGCFQTVLRRDPQNSLANRLLPESLNNARLQPASR